MKLHGLVGSILVLCFAAGVSAQEHVTLEQLYEFPYIYGHAPRAMEWSPNSKSIAFLWNEEGERFRDLYVAKAPSGEPVRLTNLYDFPRIPIEDDERTEEEIALDKAYDWGIGQLAWSPDSKTIAFVLRGDIFLVDARGRQDPRVLMRTQAGESRVRFSPDGELLSFIKSQNLWTRNLKTGEIRQLTTLSKNKSALSYPATSSIRRYEWTPDGSAIALLIWDTDVMEDIVIPDYLPSRVEAGNWKRNYTGTPIFETEVGVVDRRGGLIRWIDWGEDLYYNNSETQYNRDIVWSPDSRALLVNWNDKDYKTRRIYLADSETLELTELYSEFQEPFLWHLDALWSPDGQTVYITSEKDGYRHIYALPQGGGEARQLTRGKWDVISLHIPKKGKEILFSASEQHPLESHVYVIPPEGGTPKRVTATPGTFSGSYSPMTVSDDGRYAATRFSQFMVPPELYIVNVRKPSAENRITRSPLPAFAPISRIEPEYFTYTNEEDGATIHGFMVKPAHFDPGKKYPAVLSCVYANIAKNEWISYDLLDYYMANEMGYIVVRVDFRASVGYGRDFHYGYYQKMGIIDAGECVSAANYLRSLDYIDGKRIGMWGSSYGGFLTLMTLFTHPGVFQAGAAWKPVTNWHNYTDDYTAQRLGRPEEFPEIYEATSPIHHVEGLQDPLLIVHGMADDNVLFQDTVQLVQKLLEAGKVFDVMFYPKATHGLTYWQETRLDLMVRTVRFFRQHMGTGPTP
ncbi:MAG: prolyl oligopeptidase family serine peptidase [Candidatus Eisenbacteria sp.]|nr:prolyl oligopeptidase family serine peptidase [Candidatus Eisenbacteria bacterium]